jgi:hypothetical protein
MQDAVAAATSAAVAAAAAAAEAKRVLDEMLGGGSAGTLHGAPQLQQLDVEQPAMLQHVPK